MTTPTNVDVIIVGAGLSGLSAARRLTGLGYEVLVVEGRDRVGGRSHTVSLAGAPVDLGATWVGPTQDEVLKIAADLGCETTPTFDDGDHLIRWRGRVRAYRGTIPRLSVVELLDIARIRWQFGRLIKQAALDQPWRTRGAADLDAQSLDGWLRSVRASASTRTLMSLVSWVIWGCDSDQVSLLHAVRYTKAAGGLDRMLDTPGGAQQDRFPGGTQQIAKRMAAELGSRVLLEAPVRRIDWTTSYVNVSFDGREAQSRLAIVAIPPEHRAAIEFSPALPDEYTQLARRWPQGNLSKAYAAYETPFWRANGQSGQALLDDGPVFLTYDLSLGPEGPGILLGFAKSRDFDPLPAAKRKECALAAFASLYGDAALHPIDYLDHCWGMQPFAPGGPTAAVPPGSWTAVGPWLRRPAGPIHWAGTETANEWTGYMDGAIRSGHRAADEVAARLGEH